MDAAIFVWLSVKQKDDFVSVLRYNNFLIESASTIVDLKNLNVLPGSIPGRRNLYEIKS